MNSFNQTLVRSPEGSERFHVKDSHLKGKCGTGSNEPRFSMNRAVQFTMVALMLLGILTVTNASPNNPTVRTNGAKHYLESLTSSAETMAFKAPATRKRSAVDTSSVPVCTSSTTLLDLSHQDLIEVPDLSACTDESAECGFTSLSPRIGRLTQLTGLYAPENNISFIPAEIAALSNLKQLDLSMNSLVEFPAAFGNLTSLENLWLHGNNFHTVPQEIGHMQNLRMLVMSNCSLQALPAEMNQLHQLQLLDISYNNFPAFPLAVCFISNLVNLGSTHNNLLSLPAQIWYLSHLENLYVGFNQLTTLPVEMGSMPSLQSIVAESNRLTSLPIELANTPLSYLQVSQNLLQSIPGALLQKPGLYIDYTYTPISNGPPVCTNATLQLDLSNQDLTEVPDLSDWNPRLTSLPDSLYDLPALLELSMAGCGFTSLSPRIGRLTQLTGLYAPENKITHIPAEIAALSNLKQMDLSKNRLT
eukprot:gene26062-29438_t